MRSGSPSTQQELSSSIAATRDSVTVATWTAVSRVTGVLRVLVIAAVLGPTALGNSFQLTNTLPNLVFYGFLAGSLCSSVLVPVLVTHIDNGDHVATARIAGGLTGVAMLLLTALAPLAVILLPLALRLAAHGQGPGFSADQLHLSRWLIVMMIPQVFGYVLIGTSAAVLHAQQRFALPAAAPAVENCVLVGVLLTTGAVYGTSGGTEPVPTAELLLLGFGSTAAVAVHAGLQFLGARACGVHMRPRAGWRDPEVRSVIMRAIPAITQSALLAVQLLALLVISTRVKGGTVAMQIALNFYALPIALAATPVALALLPRLSRLYRLSRRGEVAADVFTDTYIRGTALVIFVTVPAACGYILLAGPIGEVVAVGRMNFDNGPILVSAALAAVALGLIGESSFFLSTQASYATGNTSAPLRAMAAQSALCLAACSGALGFTGLINLLILGAAFSVANIVGATLLLAHLLRTLPRGSERLRAVLFRVVVGTVAMGGAVVFVMVLVPSGGRLSEGLVLVLAPLVGLVVFVAMQWLMGAPELSWLRETLFGRSRARTGCEP